MAFLLWLALGGWPGDCGEVAAFDEGELVTLDAEDDWGGVTEDLDAAGSVDC